MGALANLSRVSTGVSGLDEVIGGGCPLGSLIILAGNPGTGKTIFSATFLYNGTVNYSEKGVYICKLRREWGNISQQYAQLRLQF